VKSLKSVLDAYDTRLKQIGGCTDGACVVVKPQGMHTNGGCKCLRNGLPLPPVAEFDPK
jgi:hypothetical protein